MMAPQARKKGGQKRIETEVFGDHVIGDHVIIREKRRRGFQGGASRIGVERSAHPISVCLP